MADNVKWYVAHTYSGYENAVKTTIEKFVANRHLEDMIIDYDRRNISISGEDIHLTQTEYNILFYLSQHTGKVMTYSAIIRAVWGSMDNGSIKKLQVNMANIRKKFGVQPGESRYVINELGVGYRMLDGEE